MTLLVGCGGDENSPEQVQAEPFPLVISEPAAQQLINRTAGRAVKACTSKGHNKLGQAVFVCGTPCWTIRSGHERHVAKPSGCAATIESAPTPEETVESDPCGEMRNAVETYDTLSPGGSREGYLLALHTFQQDCPDEALAAGLDASFLEQCEPGGFTQENCTMYMSRP